MAQPFTLGTLAALTLAGAGLGLYLGKSSVAMIDPIYFASPADTRFFADLVPNPPSQDAPPQLDDASLVTGLGTGCIGCRPPQPQFYDLYEAALPDFAGSLAVYESEPAEILDEAEQEIEETVRAAARESIERYVHFQVAAEEAPAMAEAAAEAAPEAAEEETPGI